MAAKPIDALAVDDIVQEAGVAKGSFYNHFSDKEEFASIIRDDIRQEVEAAIRLVNADVEDPASRVVRSISMYLAYILVSAERANVMRRISLGLVSSHNPLNDGVMADVAAGLRSGRFVVPSVDVGALFVMGTCQIILMRSVEEFNPSVIVMTSQQLCALLLRGLGLSFAESESLSGQAIHEVALQTAPIIGAT